MLLVFGSRSPSGVIVCGQARGAAERAAARGAGRVALAAQLAGAAAGRRAAHAAGRAAGNCKQLSHYSLLNIEPTQYKLPPSL